MSNRHLGNTQPAIDQEEHAHIGGVAGKKSFIFDASGNQIIDFVNPTSNITVEQGNAPWSSLTSVINTVDVTTASGMTVYQGSTPWISQATIEIYGSQTAEVQQDASTNALTEIDYEHHEIHGNSHYFVEDFSTLNDTDTLDFCFTTADDTAWVHLVFNFDSTGLMQLDFYENADVAADGTLVVQRANNRAKTFTGTHTPAGSSATVMTDSAASFTVDALIGWKIYNVTDGSYGIVTDNDATTVTVASLTGGAENDWDQGDIYEINRSLSILEADCTVNDVGFRLGGQSGGDATNPNRGVPGGATRNNEFILRPDTAYLFRFTSSANSNILAYNAEWYEHTDKN